MDGVRMGPDGDEKAKAGTNADAKSSQFLAVRKLKFTSSGKLRSTIKCVALPQRRTRDQTNRPAAVVSPLRIVSVCIARVLAWGEIPESDESPGRQQPEPGGPQRRFQSAAVGCGPGICPRADVAGNGIRAGHALRPGHPARDRLVYQGGQPRRFDRAILTRSDLLQWRGCASRRCGSQEMVCLG